MKHISSPLAFVTFGLLILTSNACNTPDGQSNSRQQIFSPGDSLPAALAPISLAQSDSFLVSEPSAFAVSAHHYFVADAGTSTILVYDRNGTPVSRIGRRGKGPGEFIAPAALAELDNGELGVMDAALNRISIIDSQLAVRHTIPAPGLAMSMSPVTGGMVLGVQDHIAKTSVAFVSTTDSSSRPFGPLPRALAEDPQLAASYPFSVVSSTQNQVMVGFTGSPWLYRLQMDGTVIDSVSPMPALRRGVPENLGERLRKSTSPENEAASTSMLIMLAPLSQFRTAMIHMDFVVQGTVVTGKAFMSVLGSDMRSLCTDAIVPLESDTRPMFAFHNDTLFVVQNAIANGDSVTTKVTAFLNCAA